MSAWSLALIACGYVLMVALGGWAGLALAALHLGVMLACVGR